IHQLETQDLSRLIREQTVEFIDSQEIDQKIEESVKEVVTASVQHAMRAPLRARFKDLPTSDMKEILLQRIEQFDADKAEERTKKKSKQDSLNTSPRSPPPPPPPPLPSGAAGATGPTGTSNSTQDPPPPPPSSTTNRGDQSHNSVAPGLSKTAASTSYTAWTMTISRVKSAASSILEDVLMHEESDFEAQDIGSDDKDIGIRYIPKVSLNDEWFKPLSEEERPVTPEPAWSIPSLILPIPNNNWASAIASSFISPLENSLLSQTGPAYEVVKAFHPDVIHLQFQIEECHKILTNQVNEGLLRYNVSKPLPLGGPPGQMKAASYPDAGLEQMVPDQMWAKEEYMYDISASYGISHWWFKR
ncbi:hypothetical protein Tco_1537742, partial [Tanacetum coccineum]